MIPEYLNKVKSDKKALELATILEAIHPSHSERLWLCGFLKYVGYTMTEVLDIIREHNHWVDYDEKNTAQQVASVFHQRPQPTQNRATPRPRKWSLSPIEILRIRYQRSVTLSKQLCEENNAIEYPHPERLGYFNSWSEFLQK
jgi:DNA primase large subunit